MSKYLKVEGHDHLVRESSSHAIINARQHRLQAFTCKELELEKNKVTKLEMQ